MQGCAGFLVTLEGCREDVHGAGHHVRAETEDTNLAAVHEQGAHASLDDDAEIVRLVDTRPKHRHGAIGQVGTGPIRQVPLPGGANNDPKLVIHAGLDRLPRQIATFPEFRSAMLALIPQEPALANWRARSSDDFGITLLEMWAYVCDSISFYDEVIAQEEYLRTAQLRPSLRKLVALLGYLPRPAVAAKVELALLAEGRTEDELLRAHPELTREDVAAVREYAKVPPGLRRSFGAWAEDGAELDEYLEWNRQQRKLGRGGAED